MRLTTYILIATVIGGNYIMANETNSSNIVTGTTIGHYQKPGASVYLTFNSVKAKVNEIADVNITLTTTLTQGDMVVDLDIDKNLKVEGNNFSSITFPLSTEHKDYNINLKVSSNKNGLYYIRLLAKVNTKSGVRTRALAVPVYIGDAKLQNRSRQKFMKAMSGENISVSKAEETITTLDE